MIEKVKEYYEKYQEIISYLFFGGLTTVVNIVTFFFFDTLLDIHYLLANALAIGVSILFAYVTNKKYVFHSEAATRQDLLREFGLFVSLRLFSAVFDMLSMWLLVDYLQMEANLAKILTQFIVVVSNYLFSKLFIFNQ